MTDIFESGSFVLPSQVKEDVALRLKEPRGIKSMEFRLSGSALEGAKEFGRLLLTLRRRGVKISHDISITLNFPHSISRREALELVEEMPKPKNGSIKVRIGF